MNNKDIQELLEHTKNEIIRISSDSQKGTIHKVSLKNVLENLRSILDYSARDILHHLKQYLGEGTPEKVYFPYGRRDSHFKKSVKRNLPKLKEHMPKIYKLINDIQPFQCGESWLVDLCELTNDVKHNKLSKTNNNKTKTIYQGGAHFVTFPQGTQVIMEGNRVNGVLQDDVFVDFFGGVTLTPHSNSTLITESNKLFFHGKQIEIVPFLELSHENLSKLVDSIYENLNS